MFKIGDIVRNVPANIVGEVVEVDGEVIYLEQENGAQVDFTASALVLESEFQIRFSGLVQEDKAAHAHDQIYQAVIDNLYPALLKLGHGVHAKIVPIPGIKAKSWEQLTALQQLNAISDVTNTPVKNFIDANKPGANPSLVKLQLSLLEAFTKEEK